MNKWQLTSQEQQALHDFLVKLVRTPSLPGDEGAVAELILQEMQQLGFPEVWIDEAGNVVGSLGAADGPTLLFDGHMDTVAVASPKDWSVAPWEAVERAGRLYGLGAADMKGGLAAMIHGAALLLKRQIPLAGRVLVACVGLEEPAEGTCTRVLFEEDHLRPDWVLIAEPSNLKVVRAQRGHLELLLSVKGRSAHSASPELGENAIYAASRVVFGLELLAEQLAVDAFLGPGVLAVTEIRSQAVSRNAIPDLCDLVIDRRLTVGETESLALAEVQRVVAREGINAELRVIEESLHTHTGKTYTARHSSAPWSLGERHPLVAALLQAVRDVGARPMLDKWDFATEGAYTAGVAQVPTVGFGPGDPAVVHSCDEHIDLAQVYTAASVYAAFAEKLLSK